MRYIVAILILTAIPGLCAKPPANYTESISGTLVKFDMVGIPAGKVTVGTQSVQVKALRIAKTETTWDAYDVYVYRLDEPKGIDAGDDAISRPSKPYGSVDRGYGHKGYPVINVSYYAAEQYCKWLTMKTGHAYRLSTEAEWEYACRAGSPEPNEKSLEKYAWFWQEKTQPVGQKSPNAWGIYDMLGNVAEWCAGLDGKPLVCGGSFQDFAKNVRASARQHQDDSWQANDPQNPKSKWWLSDGQFVGFRIVRDQ